MTLVLLAAFAVRVAGIDQQSIWYDEGLSIYYARGGIRELVIGTSQSEHPPLHSLLLNAWMTLFGDSELSVRSLSAWAGLLAVALLYRVGRRFSPAHGALAALLLALSPLAIWFSQEARGYMMALALTTATVDAAWALVFPPDEPLDNAVHQRWVPYLLYVGLAAAALYTHLYSAFVLLALNAAWAARFLLTGRVRREWGPALRWAGAQLAVLTLFSPWLPYVSAQWRLNATYFHGAIGWKQIVRRTLVAFSVGKTLEGPWALGATWAWTILAALGAIALYRPRQSHRRTHRWALLLLGLWLLLPIAFQIALNRTLPKFAPRYLLNALAPFTLLASAGLLGLLRHIRQRPPWQLAGWLAAFALLLATATIGGATTRSLANHYLDKSFYRSDMRGAARYIEEHATAQDLIVLVGGHNYPAFIYYYRGALPVLALPDNLLPDTRAPLDVRILETLDRAIVGRRQLWLVLWQEQLADPTGIVTDAIQHTYHRLGVGQTFHDVGLLLFDVSPGPRLSQSASPSTPLRANFDGQVRLQGYDLPETTIQAGHTLYLYLYWESLGKIENDYKVFTQVLDERGNIVAQNDKIAGAASYPTSHWPQSALVRDRFLLAVHPDTPPGRYILIAGLYRPGRDMPRLPVSGQGAQGDHVLLAEIEVQGQND